MCYCTLLKRKLSEYMDRKKWKTRFTKGSIFSPLILIRQFNTILKNTPKGSEVSFFFFISVVDTMTLILKNLLNEIANKVLKNKTNSNFPYQMLKNYYKVRVIKIVRYQHRFQQIINDYLILAHGTIPLQLCEWWILEVCNAMPSEHLLWTLSSFIIPILHLRKLMFRDGTALAQSHTPNRPRSNYSAILRLCFLLGGDDGSRFYICLLTHTGISSGAKTLSLPWESLPP